MCVGRGRSRWYAPGLMRTKKHSYMDQCYHTTDRFSRDIIH